MASDEFTIFVVDDDAGVLKALTRILETKDYRVRTFLSPRQFLSEHDASIPGCAIFDVSMPDLDGLELQKSLAASGVERPVIFLTGAGDLPIGIQAMKAGAVDFLTKPVRSKQLLETIAVAREKDAAGRKSNGEVALVNARLAKLTDREKEVLNLVVAGLLNKQIAARLGIVLNTVKLHRGRMLRKMGVRTVADLVRIAEKMGIRPEP